MGAIGLICHTCKGGTHHGGHYEEPKVAPCAPAVSLGEEALAERAGGVDTRVGQRDGDEVDERQAQSDGEAGELAISPLVGGSEDYEEEDESEDGLGDESPSHTDTRIISSGSRSEVGTVAIGGENSRLPAFY